MLLGSEFRTTQKGAIWKVVLISYDINGNKEYVMAETWSKNGRCTTKKFKANIVTFTT